MILAGDIGGTKTALGLFAPRFAPDAAGQAPAAGLELVEYGEYPSCEFSSIEAVIVRFLAERPNPGSGFALTAACFGVAGPVIGGRSELTNLMWRLAEHELSDFLIQLGGAGRVRLVNDLEAAAAGMLHLPPEDFCVLNEGTPSAAPGNIAVIAAGTGLGEAFLFWDGARYRPSATEGGHTNFAPHNEDQIELLRYMMGEAGGRVSVERVLSGPGLVSLYRFFRSQSDEPEPEWLAAELAGGAGGAAVARGAADPVCPDSVRPDLACRKALETFIDIYGAEAGDQALKVMGLSGVFIGGGIAPRILPWLRDGRFMKAFADKGRFSEMMRRIPVKVALTPKTGLIGAAWLAHEVSICLE